MDYLHDVVCSHKANLEVQPQACTAEKVSYEESFYIPMYNDETFAYSNHTIDEVFKHFFSWPSFSSFNLKRSDGTSWDPDFDSMVNLDQFSD